MDKKYTNSLIKETSPYLLQHAHNPVNWMPWGKEALDKAKLENKLLLISIGYSACHWCHVMEHESFEDKEVADVMNHHFICIKVDREERPDVDQLYMAAVQLLTKRGGWPLNAIALPDGRPIWGGTYFEKRSWINAIQQVAAYWEANPKQTVEYAEKLNTGIEQSTLIPISSPMEEIPSSLLENALTYWETSFDHQWGGRQGAPKFMMPNNLQLLLRWAHQRDDQKIVSFVETSLDKMAMGGIYDQLGGGFARYSTDSYWKVPHFEKMLYDNGQLLSLYAQAFQRFKKPLYRETADGIFSFLVRELLSPEYGFYSALDADSEGEEGKFYVWGEKELQASLGDDFDLFANYYNINRNGYWEKGNYILIRFQEDEAFAADNQLKLSVLKEKVLQWKSILLERRAVRVRPGLDDKILTSWNAMALTGLVDAYKAFGDQKYLDLALKNAAFLKSNVIKINGTLNHSFKNGMSKIEGFLEDYAWLATAFLSLFEVTGNESFLNDADKLAQKAFGLFFDEEKHLFYFSSLSEESTLNRSIEVHDNVIPSSNSAMANLLFKLGLLTGNQHYRHVSKGMLLTVISEAGNYPSGYSNWLMLALSELDSFHEIAILGKHANNFFRELAAPYQPNALFGFSTAKSNISLLKDRYKEGETLIYVCENTSCKLPVKSTNEAFALISKR